MDVDKPEHGGESASRAPVARDTRDDGLEHLTPIERTRMFIAGNFKLDLDLGQLALVAQMSKYHFARQFKAETGYTCMHYLSQVRLSEAAKLIATTRLRVSEVCYEVGFGDLTHFERLFKRDTGCTPSEYRKRFRLPAARDGA